MRPLEANLLAQSGELVDLEAFRKRKLRFADVAGLSGFWIRMALSSTGGALQRGSLRPTP